ncbi:MULTISPECIES: hypothetical protein [Sutcliffiella]|uniref:DUF1257 domain-containing protein n=1 Tax=Sutcliffiella cohnii TaxID=33932 RepID=A0A223KNJ5_9BACI|nr:MULTISPECIES: hypothetical protein [Sutcliffiella]AST90918.1 hypothetical protein BC6307_06290 [Sutcliffiella cohnii]WBL16706.1 hypothetical protein O1A01_08775 [Sutcliffiella sp. NC1]
MSLSVVLVPLALGAASSAVSFALREKVEEGVLYKIETNMKDEILLEESLKSFGCNVDLNEESFHSSIGDIQMAFQQQENGTFSGIFNESVSTEEAQEFLQDVQKEYVRLVQNRTYEKLIARARQEGLILEHENTTDDNTIQLTFQVKEKLYNE